MIQKKYENAAQAIADMQDGATLLVGGFGGSGLPSHLIAALVEQGAKDLTVVSNNIGAVSDGVAALISNNQVRKIICSFPVGPHANDLIERLAKRYDRVGNCPSRNISGAYPCRWSGRPSLLHSRLGCTLNLEKVRKHEYLMIVYTS